MGFGLYSYFRRCGESSECPWALFFIRRTWPQEGETLPTLSMCGGDERAGRVGKPGWNLRCAHRRGRVWSVLGMRVAVKPQKRDRSHRKCLEGDVVDRGTPPTHWERHTSKD